MYLLLFLLFTCFVLCSTPTRCRGHTQKAKVVDIMYSCPKDNIQLRLPAVPMTYSVATFRLVSGVTVYGLGVITSDTLHGWGE